MEENFSRPCFCSVSSIYSSDILFYGAPELGEIARAKFDFDVVGHYSRPEVLSLVVKDHPATPVTFTSAAKTEGSNK